MFTGLIQRIGVVQGVIRRDGGARFSFGFTAWDDAVVLGESIAVQGVCLTVAMATSEMFEADVLDETLDCTVLGALRKGMRVNLERALKLSDRLGGHLVSGHVDGVGTIEDIRNRGRDVVLRVACGPQGMQLIVQKGSIAVDGVSLTVSDIFDHAFEVNLIPTTLQETTLGDRQRGDRVNIETDMLGKYVQKILGAKVNSGVTLETLTNAGFI